MCEYLREMTFNDFKNNYFDRKSFVTHGSISDFPTDIESFSFTSIEEFLKIYNNPVMAVGDSIVDLTEGISNKTLVTNKESLYWYDRGCAVELDHFELFDQKLNEFIQNLKFRLGLPNGCIGKAIIYAAKDGGGFPPHFDSYTNLIFQIKGKKEWKLLQNENVSFPLEHYELLEYPYLPESLKKYWNDSGEVPGLGIAKGRTINLEKGSFLYLARGDWHKTKSEEETIALNITFTLPKKIDYILEYLKIELSKFEEYRRSVRSDDLVIFKDDNFQSELIDKITKSIREIEEKDLKYLNKNTTDVYQATQSTFRYMLKNNYIRVK